MQRRAAKPLLQSRALPRPGPQTPNIPLPPEGPMALSLCDYLPTSYSLDTRSSQPSLATNMDRWYLKISPNSRELVRHCAGRKRTLVDRRLPRQGAKLTARSPSQVAARWEAPSAKTACGLQRFMNNQSCTIPWEFLDSRASRMRGGGFYYAGIARTRRFWIIQYSVCKISSSFISYLSSRIVPSNHLHSSRSRQSSSSVLFQPRLK